MVEKSSTVFCLMDLSTCFGTPRPKEVFAKFIIQVYLQDCAKNVVLQMVKVNIPRYCTKRHFKLTWSFFTQTQNIQERTFLYPNAPWFWVGKENSSVFETWSFLWNWKLSSPDYDQWSYDCVWLFFGTFCLFQQYLKSSIIFLETSYFSCHTFILYYLVEDFALGNAFSCHSFTVIAII